MILDMESPGGTSPRATTTHRTHACVCRPSAERGATSQGRGRCRDAVRIDPRPVHTDVKRNAQYGAYRKANSAQVHGKTENRAFSSIVADALEHSCSSDVLADGVSCSWQSTKMSTLAGKYSAQLHADCCPCLMVLRAAARTSSARCGSRLRTPLVMCEDCTPLLSAARPPTRLASETALLQGQPVLPLGLSDVVSTGTVKVRHNYASKHH